MSISAGCVDDGGANGARCFVLNTRYRAVFRSERCCIHFFFLRKTHTYILFHIPFSFISFYFLICYIYLYICVSPILSPFVTSWCFIGSIYYTIPRNPVMLVLFLEFHFFANAVDISFFFLPSFFLSFPCIRTVDSFWFFGTIQSTLIAYLPDVYCNLKVFSLSPFSCTSSGNETWRIPFSLALSPLFSSFYFSLLFASSSFFPLVQSFRFSQCFARFLFLYILFKSRLFLSQYMADILQGLTRCIYTARQLVYIAT